MSYEKVGKLIDSLYTRTKTGYINWEETERTGVYQVSFPKYSVRLLSQPTRSQAYNGDETQDYIIQIINEYGIVVDEVSDIDVKDIIIDSYKKMKEMHDLARRQALGVDEALDEILRDLDDLDIPF